MVGWVEAEDVLRRRALLAPPAQLLAAALTHGIPVVAGVGLDVAGELVATQGPGDVVIARQDDEAERRHVHRLHVAQALVEGVRVGAERGVERVERDGVGGGHRANCRTSAARRAVERDLHVAEAGEVPGVLGCVVGWLRCPRVVRSLQHGRGRAPEADRP